VHCCSTPGIIYVHATHAKSFLLGTCDVNQVIVNGTDLYRYIRQQGGQSGCLSHHDLPTNLHEWNEQLSGDIEYHFDRFYGPVNGVVIRSIYRLLIPVDPG
jgi:hypothetical protein